MLGFLQIWSHIYPKCKNCCKSYGKDAILSTVELLPWASLILPGTDWQWHVWFLCHSIETMNHRLKLHHADNLLLWELSSGVFFCNVQSELWLNVLSIATWYNVNTKPFRSISHYSAPIKILSVSMHLALFLIGDPSSGSSLSCTDNR